MTDCGSGADAVNWKNPLHQMLVAVFRIFDLPEPHLLAGYAQVAVVDRTRAMLSVEVVDDLYSPLAHIRRTVDSASITLTGIPDDLSSRKWSRFWTDAIKPAVQRADQWVDERVELPGPVRHAHLFWRVRAYDLHVELGRTIPQTLAQIRREFPVEFASAKTQSDEPSRRRQLQRGIAEIGGRFEALDARVRALREDVD